MFQKSSNNFQNFKEQILDNTQINYTFVKNHFLC
jgi:hypothetical protein